MKKLTRDRVVPIISASVSWLILAIIGSGLPSLPKLASKRRARARRFSLELNSWSTKSSSTRMVAAQEMRDEHLGKRWLVVEDADHGPFLKPHNLAVRHGRGRRHAPRLAG